MGRRTGLSGLQCVPGIELFLGSHRCQVPFKMWLTPQLVGYLLVNLVYAASGSGIVMRLIRLRSLAVCRAVHKSLWLCSANQ